jgi:hypothetical protein
MAHAFGTCPCGGVYDTQVVDVRFSRGEVKRSLDSVPQGRCPSCESRVYKVLDLHLAETMMWVSECRAARRDET